MNRIRRDAAATLPHELRHLHLLALAECGNVFGRRLPG